MAEGTPAATPAPARAVPGPVAALHVERTFAAPREQVFRAWTEPEAVRRWFGSSIGPAVSAEADLRVGGSYRITVKVPPARRTAHVVGRFLEVDPPRRLVYTFTWERMPILALGMGDSKVTVEFREHGDETEVRLTHELLDKRRLRSFHRWGWNRSMARLAKVL
jgi:uncharacterized protein YndB with AHSA1/START domain